MDKQAVFDIFDKIDKTLDGELRKQYAIESIYIGGKLEGQVCLYKLTENKSEALMIGEPSRIYAYLSIIVEGVNLGMVCARKLLTKKGLGTLIA